MFLSLLLFHSALLLGQTGMIAYITGPCQAEYRMTVLDLETGDTRAIGQGDRDAFPSWSPDGHSIAYQSKQPEGTGIRIVRPAETGSDQGINHRSPWNHTPRWSPDGKKLVYTSCDDASPLRHIVVFTLDTGQETVWGSGQTGFMATAWLPSLDLMKALDPESNDSDNAAALFKLGTEAETHGAIIATGLIDTPPHLGTDLFIVTPSLSTPVLSFLDRDNKRYIAYKATPDHKARQIAYESNYGGDRELFVLGRRGIANVSNHPAADWNPVWSPDNEWLAFESFRQGPRGIYRVLVSTGNVVPVHTEDTYQCWAPDWSPDSEWIVFVSDMNGTPQLFLIRPDGGALKQVTFGDYPALCPAWQPTVPESRE